MEDWQVGDLALCVKDGALTKSGRVYVIADVCPEGVHCGCPDGQIVEQAVLKLDGVSSPWGGCRFTSFASRFRKITPPPADAFDREIIDLMVGKFYLPKVRP